jgi:hypothetical protein
MENDETVGQTAWRIFKAEWQVYVTGFSFGLLLLSVSLMLGLSACSRSESSAAPKGAIAPLSYTVGIVDSINKAPVGPLWLIYCQEYRGFWDIHDTAQSLYVRDILGTIHIWTVGCTGDMGALCQTSINDDIRHGKLPSFIVRSAEIIHTAQWIDSATHAQSKELHAR